MKPSAASPRPITLALGLLLVAGAFVVCKATSLCGLAGWSNLGDETMSAAGASSRIAHANESNFRDLVLKSETPVLVDFYADWCGPCQRLAPVLEELAREIADARIVKVNVDRSPALAAEYGITSIPSLKVFKHGTVTDEVVGLAGQAQLRAMLAP